MDTDCESPKWKGCDFNAVSVPSFKESKGEKNFVKEEASSPEQVVTIIPTSIIYTYDSKKQKSNICQRSQLPYLSLSGQTEDTGSSYLFLFCVKALVDAI